jgi:DNA repair protein RadC
MITPELKIPEITITVKMDKAKKSELYQIQSSTDAANLFRKIFDSDTIDWVESFVMLCLNRGNKVVGFYKVSKGGVTGTVADPRVIFTCALNCLATYIIVAHNHPSGNLKPSRADEELTTKIKEGGKLLDIKLLDHVILTEESHFSFADEGLI